MGRITEAQVKELRRQLQGGASLKKAALKAGMDRKSAGKYREGKMPRERRAERSWRTRSDPLPPTTPRRTKVDFAFLRQQVTMEQVLQQLGLLDNLRGRGQQRRGPCPIPSKPNAAERTFAAHLGKNVFQCFHADCGAQGNVLDLWAAMHHLPLYEAALHLAETFQLQPNREEEPVKGTRGSPLTPATSSGASQV